MDDEKINIISKDARLFVKGTKQDYDVVIIDLPDPSTAQINRFYTIEFFRELKEKLNKNAVVSLSLISTVNYINEEARQLNSVLYKTLKQVFANVISGIVVSRNNF